MQQGRVHHRPAQRDSGPHGLTHEEVCTDVEVEPRLQPLSGEVFLHSSANRDPEARLDVKARGLWGGTFECAFLMFGFSIPAHAQTRLAAQQPRSSTATSSTNDVSTTSEFETWRWRWPPSCLSSSLHPAALTHQPGSRSSASTSSTNDVSTTSEFETWRWRWPPSRLSSSLDPAALTHQPGSRSSASRLAAKLSMPYSAVMGWLRCRVSFSLLRSAVMCLCGRANMSGGCWLPRTSHRRRTLLDTIPKKMHETHPPLTGCRHALAHLMIASGLLCPTSVLL